MDSLVATIDIAGRKVGPDQPCLIIAEAGVNHNGSIETAMRLVDAAADASADAVKFQSFRAERVVTPEGPKAEYQLRTSSASESQLDMLKRLELSSAAQKELMAYCHQKGLIFISTPFDEGGADMLNDLGVPVFKISSGEITNLPFLAHIAREGKPILLSTGMSSIGEVEAAIDTLEEEGCSDIVLLHCVSNYPADPADVNLRAMRTMSRAFMVPVGYSDHTLGVEIAWAAVAQGAVVVEKHLTIDRQMPGPDHLASMEPAEMTVLVKGVRDIEAALGDGRKRPAVSEAGTAAVVRRSLVAAVDIPAGAEISEEMIAIKRPGTGLVPTMKPYLVGRTARTTVSKGALLSLEMLS